MNALHTAVIISISKSDNLQAAGSTFTLTCSAVELVDHSGDTMVTWKDPSGQIIVTEGDFMVSRRTSAQRVDYDLRFSPLRVRHSGQYTCEVAIPTVGYSDSRSIDIQVTPGSYNQIKLNKFIINSIVHLNFIIIFLWIRVWRTIIIMII